MTAEDFDAFYYAVHDHRQPFLWQSELAQEVIAKGEWPDVAVPTGVGKTSVLDIAVFHLALQAHSLPLQERTAPLRTFFVIDRRLVVDDVMLHAKKIAEKLKGPCAGVLEEVRDGLLKFGTPLPLQAHALRGGMYRSDVWADEPNQPLICVTTVDQIGSRLLFRGYGVRDLRTPVHAGLAGIDSLFIVDEAHLSKPFLDTLTQVSMYQTDRWRKVGSGLPLRFVRMSATLPEDKTRERFTLTAARKRDCMLQQRLRAPKIAELRETSNIVRDVADEARKLSQIEGVNVTGIVVNTVGAARGIFEELRKKGKAVLLTSRIRPYDRDILLASYLDRMKAWRDRTSTEKLFVVATQTVEVGADLDFDALISESAPLDALRQRFGRLNRLGRPGTSRAVIFKAKAAKASQLIYGDGYEKTWEWLNEHASKNEQKRMVDFGIDALGALLPEDCSELDSPHADGVVMMPAHVDTWVQTRPRPEPDPDVSPFLHGAKAVSDAADVQIVWRADLGEDPNAWQDILAEVPPQVQEALPLPLWTARRWLRQEPAKEVSDLEGRLAEPSDEDARDEQSQHPLKYLIWRGPDVDGSEPIRPGDTIVVRSEDGGADEFGWSPQSKEPVRDVGDECANARAGHGLGRYRFRVHPDVLFWQKEQTNQRDELQELLTASDGDGPDLRAIRELLELTAMPSGFKLDDAVPYGAEVGLLWTSRTIEKASETNLVTELDVDDADDDTDNFTSEVSLRVHTSTVKARARKYAERCGLCQDLVEDIALAAELHDLGKCDQRFQLMLNPARAEAAELLAKSRGKRSRVEANRNQAMAGYPRNARHEFASVALAERSLALKAAHDRDLVLHLIGAHHGHGRSMAPYWRDEAGLEVTADVCGESVTIRNAEAVAQIDSGWTDRFWVLVEKYGYWGLVYLEAILRRADCVQSREEERRG